MGSKRERTRKVGRQGGVVSSARPRESRILRDGLLECGDDEVRMRHVGGEWRTSGMTSMDKGRCKSWCHKKFDTTGKSGTPMQFFLGKLTPLHESWNPIPLGYLASYGKYPRIFNTHPGTFGPSLPNKHRDMLSLIGER